MDKFVLNILLFRTQNCISFLLKQLIDYLSKLINYVNGLNYVLVLLEIIIILKK